jgi:hypothetical protein
MRPSPDRALAAALLASACALAGALAGACTDDVVLGSRPCDPGVTECACTTTAECRDGYYCMPDNALGHHCELPPDCTNATSCPAAPACDNTNTCLDPDLACCAADLTCYPATCAGCCE